MQGMRIAVDSFLYGKIPDLPTDASIAVRSSNTLPFARWLIRGLSGLSHLTRNFRCTFKRLLFERLLCHSLRILRYLSLRSASPSLSSGIAVSCRFQGSQGPLLLVSNRCQQESLLSRMPPPPLITLVIALLSAVVSQEVGGATPVMTLPLARRTLHNSVSHRPISHWENIKNGMRANFGYGKARDVAIEAIQRREELAKRSIGTFGLVDQYGDSSYLVSINIGTPPQQFSVVPQTGSS